MSYPGSYGTKNNQKFPLQHCQQQIPPGWITQFDQKSKRNFYVDTRTGQSHWVLPNLVHHPQQYQQPAPQYQPPQQYQPPVIQQYQPPHYQSQIPQHYQQPMIPQNHRPANFQYQQSALSHNQIQQSLPNFHQNTVEPHQFNDVSLPKHNTFPSYKPQSLPNLHTFNSRPGYQSPPSLDYQSPHTSHYLPATQVYENVATQSHPPARLQNPPPAQQATASPQYQYIKPSSMHRISWGKPLKHDDAVGQAKSLIVAFNDSEKARDEALISFLSTYSPIQIKQVDEIYSKLTSGKKIKEKICDKGDFGKLLEALLMYEEGEFDAFCIRDALTGGLLKDEDTLIEILVGRTNEDINSILIGD
ncbi:hypothetical protein HDU92_003508 [Lobulomyces angularis]|nr:hypothetical protein HDU92_003508 [Lobulomyces angularis]